MNNIRDLFSTVDKSGLRINEAVKLLQVSRVTYHKWQKIPDRKPHALFASRANMLVFRANELLELGDLPIKQGLSPKERWGIITKLFPALTNM